MPDTGAMFRHKPLLSLIMRLKTKLEVKFTVVLTRI